MKRLATIGIILALGLGGPAMPTLAQEGTAGAAPATKVVGVPGAGESTASLPAPGTGTPGTSGTPAGAASPFGGIFLPLLLVMVLMIVMSIFSSRKEKKRRGELMSSLKKHDRVLTTGGMIGTIVEINEQDVVLRMEEGRIRFTRAAISQILNSAGGSKPNAVVEAKDELPARVS